jgi:hypothetical protein
MKAPKLTFALLSLVFTLVSADRVDGRGPHARLDLLAQDGVERGNVSYGQIVRAFYGEDAEAVLALKRSWRESRPDVSWLSEYDFLLDVAVNVVVDRRVGSTDPEGAVLARYTLETNTARIPRASAGAMLAHEVAHGLTRRSVRCVEKRASVDSRIALAGPPPEAFFARESGFHPGWLAYVCSQVEFEVRLQALNRVHYEVAGRVVDSPAEALRALVALGVDVSKKEAAAVLAALDVPEAESAARSVAGTTRRTWSHSREAFRNAEDLRLLIQMASGWNPDLRRSLLEKIALEAPGHL